MSNGQPWPQSGQHDAPQWSIKTEEEEYLGKLEQKLARLQQNGSKPSSNKSQGLTNNTSLSDDDEHDTENSLRLANDDDPGIHLLYDQSPPTTGRDTTPSPPPAQILTPENALQLHLDLDRRSPSLNGHASAPATPKLDHDAPPRHPADPTQHDHDPEVDVSEVYATGLPSPHSLRVRFRSRVRIGSGVHHAHAPNQCSGDSSPSSSISAPLRSHGEGSDRDRDSEAGEHHGAESLTTLLDADMANAWLQRNVSRAAGRGGRGARRPRPRPRMDERTPLNAGVRRPGSYVNVIARRGDDDAEGSDRLENAARKTQEDVVFGRWPWRLTNRHWWWWKMEPIACYCCTESDDSDNEN